jgi:hypothetical protein
MKLFFYVKYYANYNRLQQSQQQTLNLSIKRMLLLLRLDF